MTPTPTPTPSPPPLPLPPLPTCTLAVIGLGYVGLPLAACFASTTSSERNGEPLQRRVIGYDVNAARVEELRQGHDRTRELSAEELQQALAAGLELSTNPADLAAGLTTQLQAAGAGAAEAQALVAALAQLGSSPSIANLTQAVNAFNAMEAAAPGTALKSLAAALSPIRTYLITVIANIRVIT